MTYLRSALAAVALLALDVSPVSAQGAPMVVGAQPGAARVLRAGTSVPMRTLAELTTNGKQLKVGHRFELETTDAVSVDGQVVIPAGSRAMGEVTRVRNKGMWGKSGAIEARMLYVSANGRQMRLSGSLDDKGTTGTAGVVGAAVVLPVVGFFVTGTSAVIASGTQVRGFLEEDVPVTFAGPAIAAPMVVPSN